ncbi:MAG: Re/Si-specific NAD(P)(+) transhydrogenase subunit alpha [Planctomycetes bacterium]|nr:Re/Si-specific NAD(P)(+) transhydrogenase subunit alpha [Planctomycetota bacterium]MCB9890928.1 Re/Si-specific NAD(P)(+) transhydrogenase subunit alpha [Planctomycetota bacterium]
MTLFVPKEIRPGETRVAAVPDTVKRYVKDGMTVRIQAGAGSLSRISDADYEAVGATIVQDAATGWREADLIAKVQPPMPMDGGKHELDLPKEGAAILSFFQPTEQLEHVNKLQERKLTMFSMHLVPRISRAQSMDALSSQANLAGYKAVLMAADKLEKFFPMLMTAAGTISPARVVIMGAGVAGLQAIATAKRLGAIVEVSDIRPAVKEQVESLGAKFIEVGFEEGAEDAGGYARQASEEFLAKQKQIVGDRIAQADCVITTALVAGKKAPLLVTDAHIQSMKPGSVIVDLAVEAGGNVEGSAPDQVVVKHDVTILGVSNVPATMPVHSSELYSKNIQAVLRLLHKDGALKFDLEDEITKGSLVTLEGKIVHEPTEQALQGGAA